MLKLDTDTTGLAEMISSIGETGKAGRDAAKTAFRDLRKHILSVTKKDAAKAVGLPERAFKTRYISDPASPNGLRVWVGTNPLPVAVLGLIRQEKTGARAGKKDYPRAFVATMPTGHRSIFMRRTSPAWSREWYRGTRKKPSRRHDSLPIAEALGWPIREPVVQSFSSRRAEFADYFRRKFFEELKQKTKGR